MVCEQEVPERTKIDELAQSLAEVLEPLSGDELVCATVEAILKHRALMEHAESAYHTWNAAPDESAEKARLFKAYNDAMMNNRAQIAIVAALTDKLGYIPEIPAAGETKE